MYFNCALLIVDFAQHEGDFAFKEAWFHLYDDYPVKHESDRLPPPLVADLNGDGKKEVLVATNDAKIQVKRNDSQLNAYGLAITRCWIKC